MPLGVHVREYITRSRPPLAYTDEQMDYAYNRRAFRSVRNASNIEPLALVYCELVLTELGIKESLRFCQTPHNGGHNLPQLIQRVALRNPRAGVALNSLQVQLASALTALFSQSKLGTARNVPATSYPHIRYLRHSSDWPSQCSSDADLTALSSLMKRIMHLLTTGAGVSL